MKKSLKIFFFLIYSLYIYINLNNKTMKAIEKYLLNEYKKNGILKVTRFAEGAYQIETNGKFYMVESRKSGAILNNEWICREGKFEEYFGNNDNYVDHFNSLAEAEFALVQKIRNPVNVNRGIRRMEANDSNGNLN